jgi:hypothetical protein
MDGFIRSDDVKEASQGIVILLCCGYPGRASFSGVLPKDKLLNMTSHPPTGADGYTLGSECFFPISWGVNAEQAVSDRFRREIMFVRRVDARTGSPDSPGTRLRPSSRPPHG